MELDWIDYKQGNQWGKKVARREENSMVLRVMRAINPASHMLNWMTNLFLRGMSYPSLIREKLGELYPDIDTGELAVHHTL